MAKKKLTAEEMKQIAAWASTHKDWTDAEIADLFHVSTSQVRYARQKWSELSDLALNTKRGKEMLGTLISGKIDEREELESQVRLIISQLSADTSMSAGPRLKLMKEVMIIKEKLLKTGLIGHLRGLDAQIVAAIVRRYDPHASEEDIQKIYYEEKMKLEA
jgi:predicted transcriptional regulator